MVQHALLKHDPPIGKYPKENVIEKLNLEHFYTVLILMAAGLFAGGVIFAMERVINNQPMMKD